MNVSTGSPALGKFSSEAFKCCRTAGYIPMAPIAKGINL